MKIKKMNIQPRGRMRSIQMIDAIDEEADIEDDEDTPGIDESLESTDGYTTTYNIGCSAASNAMGTWQ